VAPQPPGLYLSRLAARPLVSPLPAAGLVAGPVLRQERAMTRHPPACTRCGRPLRDRDHDGLRHLRCAPNSPLKLLRLLIAYSRKDPS
jgi:hypothetical protein